VDVKVDVKYPHHALKQQRTYKPMPLIPTGFKSPRANLGGLSGQIIYARSCRIRRQLIYKDLIDMFGLIIDPSILSKAFILSLSDFLDIPFFFDKLSDGAFFSGYHPISIDSSQ
jgi:hypothetical protein